MSFSVQSENVFCLQLPLWFTAHDFYLGREVCNYVAVGQMCTSLDGKLIYESNAERTIKTEEWLILSLPDLSE